MDLQRANKLIDAASTYIFAAENRISQLEQIIAEQHQIIFDLRNQLETAIALSTLIGDEEQLKYFQSKLDQLGLFLLPNQNE